MEQKRSNQKIANLEIYTDGSLKKSGQNMTFGGWSFIASIRMIMSIMESSLGAALSMFFRNISFFFTAFFSGKSLLIGTILGLLMFFRLRNRNAEETAEEETAEEAKESAPREEEIIETSHYKFH